MFHHGFCGTACFYYVQQANRRTRERKGPSIGEEEVGEEEERERAIGRTNKTHYTLLLDIDGIFALLRRRERKREKKLFWRIGSFHL